MKYQTSQVNKSVSAELRITTVISTQKNPTHPVFHTGEHKWAEGSVTHTKVSLQNVKRGNASS